MVTAGVDPNVIQFSFVPARQNSDWKDWIGSPLHRQHSHDVRAIQMVKNGVVSGGTLKPITIKIWTPEKIVVIIIKI